MVIKQEFAGQTWTWVEKGSGAALIRDEEGGLKKMIWNGSPRDPMALVRLNLEAPIELLLLLSRLRLLDIA